METMPFYISDCWENIGYSPKDDIILLTFDNNIVEQTINLMHSICHYNTRKISFVCICYQLSEESIAKLLATEFCIKLYLAAFTVELDSKKWPIVTFFRLISPWILEPEIQRVLYLDSDILCTGDLTELFQLDVPGIAMCNEITGNVSIPQQAFFGKLVPAMIYCNAGVLIMNYDYIRSHFTANQIVTELQELSLRVADQDYLNLKFQGHITYMNGFKYDLMPKELMPNRPLFQDALRHCRLIHFATTPKPWYYKCDIRMVYLFYKYTTQPEMKQKMKRTLIRSALHTPVKLAHRMLLWGKQIIRKLYHLLRGK